MDEIKIDQGKVTLTEAIGDTMEAMHQLLLVLRRDRIKDANLVTAQLYWNQAASSLMGKMMQKGTVDPREVEQLQRMALHQYATMKAREGI